MNKEKFLIDLKNMNSQVEIVGELKDWHEKVKYRCLICNNYFYMTPLNLKRGSIHKECSRALMGVKRRKSNEDFVNELKNINPDIEALEKYQKTTIPIKVRCKICGSIWNATPNNLLRRHGCMSCFNKNKKGRLSSEKFDSYISEIHSKFPDLIFLTEPSTVNKNFMCKCKKCNNQWSTTLYSLSNLTSDSSCPYCTGRFLDINKFNLVLSEKKLLADRIPTQYSDGINCTCKTCGYSWHTTATRIFKINGCPRCNDPTKKSNEDFLKEVKQKNPHVEILSIYKNANTKVKRQCLKCGDISYQLPSSILAGVCNVCASKKLSELYSKSHEQYCIEFEDKFGKDYQILNEYQNIHTKLLVKHILCGNTFQFTASRISNKAVNICPYCYVKNSNGERRIQKYFNDNCVKYNTQKKFDDLCGVNGGLLSYDFYLPDNNLLIEYQGMQHYKPVKGFGGDNQFKKQQEHDYRKRKYAADNNIELLEIPYWDYDNIENIIESKLFQKTK